MIIATQGRLEVVPILVSNAGTLTAIRLTFNNVRYTLHVCAVCCRGTELHYCNGTSTYQSWEDVICNHLSTPLYFVFHPNPGQTPS